MSKRLVRVCLVALFVSAAALGNDLSVDRHTARVGETITITLSLENDFAAVDHINLPVRNLAVSPEPSVSSEFSWINGQTVRRKVFRFAARAEVAGVAQVGPLLVIGGPQRQLLGAILLRVVPDLAASSNDPAVVLRELLSSGRDPIFVICTADKTQAFVGEPVTATWWLYNAAPVQQWQVRAIPKLPDFWTEEIDVRRSEPSQLFVGETTMQRVPIRRVVLFPLHSGELSTGSMEIDAAVMHRSADVPLGMFEGSVEDVSYSSAPVTVTVRPLPAAAAGALVGDLSLSCSPPRETAVGPVIIDVTLWGRANVRAAQPPQFASEPAADVQIIDRGVSVDAAAVSLTRRWQYLLSPSQSGRFTVPELRGITFSPAARTARILRCGATTLTVSAPSQAARSPRPGSSKRKRDAFSAVWIVLLAVGFASALAVVFLRAVRRQSQVRRRVRSIVGDGTPEAVRERLHHLLTSCSLEEALLLRETSERGDAYRSLRSLIDALERERIELDRPLPELRSRVREFLETLDR